MLWLYRFRLNKRNPKVTLTPEPLRTKKLWMPYQRCIGEFSLLLETKFCNFDSMFNFT